MAGGAITGSTKWHEYLFQKSDSGMEDGPTIAGGQKESNLTTINRQKNLGGITELKLMTVRGLKNYRGDNKG